MSIKTKESGNHSAGRGQVFVITGVFTGFVLGSFLMYFIQGKFPYEVFAGGLVATVVLIIIEAVKRKQRNDNLPEADERIRANISRFFAYASHTALTILFITLAVLTLLGDGTIPIFYLWIFFFAYILTAGTGGLIVKNR